MKITATKQITTQGNSLAILLTKELKNAGFKKGDMVTITIESTEEEKLRIAIKKSPSPLPFRARETGKIMGLCVRSSDGLILFRGDPVVDVLEDLLDLSPDLIESLPL